MKNTRFLLIIVELLILYSKCVSMGPQNEAIFCKPPKPWEEYQTCFVGRWTSLIPIDKQIEKLEKIRLTSDIVNIIKNDAFKPFYLSATTLILDLPDQEIIIEPDAFKAMSQLTTLEINNAIVPLSNESFKYLYNLRSLKIQVLNSTSKYLGNVLQNDISNLENLELLNHYSIDICNYYNRSIEFLKLRKLQFTGGILTTLFAGCFKCLKDLEQLTIIKSNLSFLEPEVFDYLYKLKNVTLVSNDKLTHIPSNVFNIPTLKFIDLSNNSIKNIDRQSFAGINRMNLSLLNLSYNALEVIEINVFKNIHCSLIDLTYNNIETIESGAFNGSQIKVIYLYDNKLDEEDDAIYGNLDNKTRLYLNYQPNEIAIIQKKKQIDLLTDKIQNCYFSNYHSFEICKSSTSLISVKQLVPGIWTPKSLEILDDKLLSIDNNVFHNLNISDLIINSAVENFELNEGSFTGLENLKILKLKTKSLPFKTSVFHPLKSLTFLEISIGTSDSIQCQLIHLLNKLRVLLISNVDRVNICSKICENYEYYLSILRFTNSTFTHLQSMAFVCLEKLDILSITNSSLETITPGAFDRLSNLKILEITSSRLTRIHRNTFEILTDLRKLILRNNTINIIDDESFINNKLLSVLDLSFNSLQSIHEKTFKGENIENLDLSYNNISLIENGAFANMTSLDHLHVDHNNPSLTEDLVAWSITESQIDTECQRHNTLEICFKHNSISSVNVNEEKIARPSTFGAFIEIHTREIRFTCDDFVTSISPNAFKDSNIKSELKTLKIYRKRRNGFVLYPGSFEGLTVLENLIIDVGVIELKVGLFDSLKSLKYLKFKPNEMLTGVYLGQVLANLTNLKTLEIFNNDSIGICDSPFSDILPLSITELCYTNGQIDKLEKYSFICLPSLENITITKTRLAVVEYAFDILDNLKYINLAFNQIRYIDSDVFKDLKKLIKLELNNNKINEIEDESFSIRNSANLRLVNLSYNEISIVKSTIFQDIKCSQLDLSNNKIGIIEDAAFEGTSINDIYLFDNPYIILNRHAWMVSRYTLLFSNKISYTAIRCQSKQQNKCITCHYNCLQPQDRALIEPIVMS